jgi:hypothetical protein
VHIPHDPQPGGEIVVGQDLQAIEGQTGEFVQTALGSFVRETYAADCARFLAELHGRVHPEQDLRSIDAQPHTA